MEVEASQVEKYGIVAGIKNSIGQIQISHVVEKPSRESAPSRYALPGRYVFTAEIFNAIKNSKPGKNGEIQLTDAMTDVAKKSGMIGAEFKARRFDAGDKIGFIMANIEFALMRDDIAPELKTYLKKLVQTL
jgi:UTP--glucose-1-phosphate uridylyltransferase